MAISDRITSIEEHIKESYQELEGIGIDTTGVNKNLENIPKLIDGYWETLPKVTGEGTSITLDNTKEGKMKIDLKGNTSQESTTQSANLFDEEYYNNDSLYSINAYKNTKLTRIKERGTLYFKAQLKTGKSEIGSFYLCLSNKQNPNTMPNNTAWAIYGTIVADGSTIQRNYATFDTSDDLYFTFYPATVAVDTIFDTYDFLISTNNISYVPFVPNSPSPDYPQDIHVVSGDNEINITGKNLFSGDYSQFDSIGGEGTTYGYFKLPKANTRYTLTLIAKKDFTPTNYTYIGFTGNGGNATAGYYWAVAGNMETFAKGSTKTIGNLYTGNILEYVSLFNNNAQTLETFTEYFDIQLEEGTTATDYEPYQGASYPINLGKNLIPFTNQDFTLNNVRYYVENGSLVLNGTSTGETSSLNANFKNNFNFTLPKGTYTISHKTGITACFLYKYDDNTSILTLGTNATSQTFTLESETKLFIGFYIYQQSFANINTEIMISTKGGDYKPYITPIELCKIGDYQDRFIRNSGKNLYDRANATENRALNWGTGEEFGETGSITSDFIRTTKGDKFTITFSSQIMFYDSNKEYLGCLQSGGETIAKTTGNTWKYFTTPNVDEIYYVKIGTRANADGGVDKLNANIMLNKGYEVISYEPYGNGDWYLEKKIGKIIFNGTESWGGTSFGNYYRTQLSIDGIISGLSANDIELYSNYFYGNNGALNAEQAQVGMMAHYRQNNNVYFVTNESDYNAFKTWLSTHNTTFYYRLNTPTYTKIEGELLSQLNALAKSYNSQTNISQESNDLASLLNATALGEME